MGARAVPAPIAQLPNALTILRFALVPVFVVLLARAEDGQSWAAATVFAARRGHRPGGRLARTEAPGRVAVREVRRPARRPPHDRRRRRHALHRGPPAVGGARHHHRARSPARARNAIRPASRLRVLRELPREARNLDPLPRHRARDRHRAGHRLAAGDLLDRRRPRRRGRGVVRDRCLEVCREP